MTATERPLRWLLLLLLLVVVGCGPRTGTVSGRVTFEGRTVVSGQVAFTPVSTGVPCSGLIASDGTYTVTNIPPGSAMITVVSPDPAQPDDAEKSAPPEAERPPGWFPLPARFAERSGSTIRFEVRPGQQLFNLELE